MSTFIEPTLAIIQKLRLNANLLTKLPSSSIHSQFPNDIVDTPGVYLIDGPSPLSQIVGSANRTSQILVGSGLWQISVYSKQSVDEAKRIGLIACEALLPSIVTAGLWKLDYSFERVIKNKLFDCWQADYTITCPLREWRTKELL